MGWYNSPALVVRLLQIASPEHKFQPQEFYAPVDKTGDPSTGLPESIQPQQTLLKGSMAVSQNFLGEPSLNPLVEVEEDHQILQAIGFAIQSLGRGRRRIDLPTAEITAAYRYGIRVIELAEKYDVSVNTIYNRLHDVALLKHSSPKVNLPLSSQETTTASVQSEKITSNISSSDIFRRWYLNQLRESIKSREPGSTVVGKAGFDWQKELSVRGKWLYELLICDMGDKNMLLLYAAEEGYDLDEALNELRKHNLLNENDSYQVRLISGKLT